LIQGLLQHGQEAGIAQVRRGHVDADPEIRMGAQCHRKVAQDVAHHQPGNLSHKTALLGDLDEDIGADREAFLIGPARQRLSPHDFSAGQVHNWLIHHPQPVPANRPAQLLLHAPAAPVDVGERKPEQSAAQPPRTIYARKWP